MTATLEKPVKPPTSKVQKKYNHPFHNLLPVSELPKYLIKFNKKKRTSFSILSNFTIEMEEGEETEHRRFLNYITITYGFLSVETGIIPVKIKITQWLSKDIKTTIEYQGSIKLNKYDNWKVLNLFLQPTQECTDSTMRNWIEESEFSSATHSIKTTHIDAKKEKVAKEITKQGNSVLFHIRRQVVRKIVAATMSGTPRCYQQE